MQKFVKCANQAPFTNLPIFDFFMPNLATIAQNLKRTQMPSIKINLSEAQASFMLPLLDELHIDYTQEYELDDEEQSRLKETLERYKNDKLEFVSSAEFQSQMATHRQDLEKKYGHNL